MRIVAFLLQYEAGVLSSPAKHLKSEAKLLQQQSFGNI